LKLDWIRNEITRLRGAIRAQEREIRMLQRAGVSTASAELRLSRTRAKVDDLCRVRETMASIGLRTHGAEREIARPLDIRQKLGMAAGSARYQPLTCRKHWRSPKRNQNPGSALRGVLQARECANGRICRSTDAPYRS
jgi:hypothetical protein